MEQSVLLVRYTSAMIPFLCNTESARVKCMHLFTKISHDRSRDKEGTHPYIISLGILSLTCHTREVNSGEHIRSEGNLVLDVLTHRGMLMTRSLRPLYSS